MPKTLAKTSNAGKVLKKVLAPYRNLVVVGGNFGDEGKGKIIDLVMAHYDVTVRFSGGANAGHTVYTSNGPSTSLGTEKKLVSHLIPCGLAQGKECVMGRGELVDLRLFLEELEQSKKILGEKLAPIWLDQMSPLWTPWHGMLEAWLEYVRGKGRVGTTGKGIGPLEGLYKLRMAPLVGQIFLPKTELVKVLTLLYETLRPIFKEMESNKFSGVIARSASDEAISSRKKIASAALAMTHTKIPSPAEVADMLKAFAPKVKPFLADTSFVLHRGQVKKQRMLFEGAQALGLDSHFGTYPFVSSGNSAAFGAAVGTGLPMQSFDATLMVVKTLPTRVGRGPFPSEMWEREHAMKFAKEHPELFVKGHDKGKFLWSTLEKINAGKATGAEWSQYFQVLGDERGATTGRGRSVGFIDIPWLLYAIRINGPKWLALTRFDMLSGVKKLPVVVGYKLNGKMLAPGQLPPPWDMDNVKPVFENWPGWSENIYGKGSEKELPASAKNFLKRLEKHLRVPILLVGTGPERHAIIVRT